MKRLLAVLVVVLIPMLFTVCTVKAGCNTYGQYYQQAYQTEIVQQIVPVAYPVPFTVAVPVVSYLYNGGAFSPMYQAQPTPAAVQIRTPCPPVNTSFTLTDAQIDQIIQRIAERSFKANIS